MGGTTGLDAGGRLTVPIRNRKIIGRICISGYIDPRYFVCLLINPNYLVSFTVNRAKLIFHIVYVDK